MKDINSYRKGLVCLVPKRGLGGITCHEKTLCDCQVLEIYDAYDQLLAKSEQLVNALEWIKNPDHFDKSCLPIINEALEEWRKGSG